MALKTQELLHKLQGQDEKPDKLGADRVSAVLKLAKCLQMTRYLSVQYDFWFQVFKLHSHLPTPLKVKDVQKHLSQFLCGIRVEIVTVGYKTSSPKSHIPHLRDFGMQLLASWE